MAEYINLFNDPSGILIGHVWLWFASVFCLYYIQFHNRVFYNRSGLLTNLWTIYLVSQIVQCVVSMIRINHFPNSYFLGACLLCTLATSIHIQALVLHVFCIACTTKLSSLLDSKWIGRESIKNQRLYLLYGSSFLLYLIVVFSFAIASVIKIVVIGIAFIYYTILIICIYIIYKKMQIDPRRYPPLSIDRDTTQYTLTDEKMRLLYNVTASAMIVGVLTIFAFCMCTSHLLFFFSLVYCLLRLLENRQLQST